MKIFFQRIHKTLLSGHFQPFLPKFWQKWIFLEKKGSITFWIFQLSTIVQKIRKQIMTHSWNRQTNRQTFFWKKGSVSFWILQLSTTVQKRKNNNDPFLKDRPRDFFMEKSAASFWILQLSTIVQKIQKK